MQNTITPPQWRVNKWTYDSVHNFTIIRHVLRIAKSNYGVCMAARKEQSSTTGRIFMKFCIWVLGFQFLCALYPYSTDCYYFAAIWTHKVYIHFQNQGVKKAESLFHKLNLIKHSLSSCSIITCITAIVASNIQRGLTHICTFHTLCHKFIIGPTIINFVSGEELSYK